MTISFSVKLTWLKFLGQLMNIKFIECSIFLFIRAGSSRSCFWRYGFRSPSRFFRCWLCWRHPHWCWLPCQYRLVINTCIVNSLTILYLIIFNLKSAKFHFIYIYYHPEDIASFPHILLELKIKLNFTIYSITILKKSLVKTVHEYLFTCMNFNQIDKTQNSVAKIANLWFVKLRWLLRPMGILYSLIQAYDQNIRV